MNFHALAPVKYKRAVVSGIVHRIMRACSTFVHESFVKAKKILQSNQYPSSFYDPMIKKSLHSILDPPDKCQEIDLEEGE